MRPTKDLQAAIRRLRESAPFLMCREPGRYGGSIENDIAAVLMALGEAQSVDARRAVGMSEPSKPCSVKPGTE